MNLKSVVVTLLSSAYPFIGVTSLCMAGQETSPQATDKDSPTVIRDLIWIWGNPEMTKPGEHTPATFTQASPAQRARLLGAPNIIMAGHGLPNDDKLADRLTQEALGAKRLVWEIAADGKGGPPFVYTKRMAQVRGLVDKYPKIEAVLLDDMSSVGMDKGFKPEHIRQIRSLLPGAYRKVKIWGVVYTMNLDRKGVNEYIKELDVINLWVWHAKDVVKLEQYMAHCERQFPDKPIVLGLYLYDYGNGRRIPREFLETQCETARKLAQAGRIQGIVFLTINDDPEAVSWAAEWVRRVGGQKLGSR
ncbi:MAG: hypothetical protein JXQ73_31865 [Phycisphaerae bacterium]|nr:hypothetical protein [Phycisphaerae bacterium]